MTDDVNQNAAEIAQLKRAVALITEALENLELKASRAQKPLGIQVGVLAQSPAKQDKQRSETAPPDTQKN